VQGWRVATTLAAGLVIAVACGEPREARHLVVVTLDTLRADRLGTYGYDRPTSPNLDRLARRGVRFDDAITASVSTPPSHATLFTGLLPPRHGLRRLWGEALSPDALTLAEILAGQGFTTAAFVSALPVARNSGLAQGFDTYRQSGPHWPYRVAPQTNGAVERWLETKPAGRLFLWVHYFDPHKPYRADAASRKALGVGGDPPFAVPPRSPTDAGGDTPEYDPEIAELGRAVYDAEVRLTDRALGELLERLDAAGILENAVIAVVADHGELLGEHGYFFGHWDVFDETARVPFLLVDPSGRFAGHAVESTVRTADLLPTVLAWLGLAAPEPIDGRDLTPLLDGREEGARQAYTEQFEHFPVRSLRAGPWLLVEKGDLEDDAETRVYRRDPGTGRVQEVDAAPPERIGALRRALHAAGDADGGIPRVRRRVNEETAEQLRALGYAEEP